MQQSITTRSQPGGYLIFNKYAQMPKNPVTRLSGACNIVPFAVVRAKVVLPLAFAALLFVTPSAFAATCNGLAVTVDLSAGQTTTSGNDVILGTSGADVIYAQGGDDVICGLGGDDFINAGRGDDWVDAGPGNDEVIGANGNDVIFGADGDDDLFGGPGADTINGDLGDDTIFGNSGADTINGGGGADNLRGGSGNDVISTGSGTTVGTPFLVDAGAGNDTITGGPDADVIRGSTDRDTIRGGGGDDQLFGGGGEDFVDGQDGADFIRGNAANDELLGGVGNDDIDGGASKDLINGGIGNDQLAGRTGNDEIHGDSGDDVISGGGGNDRLFGNEGVDDLKGDGGNDYLDGGPDAPDSCDGGDGTNTITDTCEGADPDIDVSDYELVFADEFESSTLDPGKWATALLWGPYQPINNEQQLYVDTLGMHSGYADYTPFDVSNGTLKITATPTSANLSPPARPAPPPANRPFPSTWRPYRWAEYNYNGPSTDSDTGVVDPGYQESEVDYLSGIITSYESFKMSHGYVEARAKLPGGRGLWPAFWMLPTHYVQDVPEIDVMEFLGHDVDRVYHTYHYFNVANNWELVSTPSYTTIAADWTSDFHTYGMAWSPKQIVWYVDGIETRRIDASEYRIAGQAMYLLANLAVGGNWPGAPDANTAFPATFELDYIRAYKKKLSPQLNLANDYQLMFNDEFGGNSLDPAKWKTHFLWGPYLPINNERQYYVDALGSDSDAGTRTPFVVNDGILSIVARAADDPDSYPIPLTRPDSSDAIWTNFPTFQQFEGYQPQDYTSGIITSYSSFKFANGYAEIRAKIPNGDGLWPAFWLLNGYYVGPQPEIDVMEVRGENPHQIVHSYHRRDMDGSMQMASSTTDSGEPIIGYADTFHTYGVRWRHGEIVWYIDGQPTFTYVGDDVSYQLMYVIANLAVGGDFNFSPVDESLFAEGQGPVSLDIDYIRVYQEKDQ